MEEKSETTQKPEGESPEAEAEPAWLLALRVAERPGVLAAVASVFAQRGVSLASAVGHDGADDPDGLGVLMVTFRATAKRKQELQRVLQRLPRVTTVQDYPYHDPHLRKAVLLRTRPGAALDRDAAGGLTLECVGERADGDLYLIVGSPTRVDAWLAPLRDDGVVVSTTHATMAL